MTRTREQVVENITNLENSLAAGVLSSNVDGTSVTFDDFEGLLKRIQYFKDILDDIDGVERSNKLYRNVSMDNGGSL